MNLKLKIIVSFLILTFFLKVGKAQFNCVFEHFSTENGLSHGSVSSMLKDQKGFMWFATWDGINRFDGATFKTFKPNDGAHPYFCSNRIESMVEDLLGNIWIMTYDSKVFRLNQLTEAFEPVLATVEKVDRLDVTSIVPALGGDVWVATQNAGAFRIISDTATMQFEVEQYAENEKFWVPDNNIRFVKQDAFHNVWINSGKGIVCYEKSKETSHLALKVFSISAKALFDRSGISSFYSFQQKVYLGTSTGELLIYDLSSNGLEEISFQNTSPVSAIVRDNKGTVYIGTSGNGIFEYQESSGKVTEHYSNLQIANVLKMYVDSHNLIWIETTLPGYSMVDPSTKSCHHFEQELDVNQEMRSSAQCGITEDKNHTIWLMLKGGGFGYYNRLTGTVEYFYNKPGDPRSKISNYVYNFYLDSTNVLWLSTYFKGIEKVTFQPQRFNFTPLLPQSNFTIANEVRAILEDSKGMLWVATKKQELFLLDRNFSVVTRFDHLAGQKIGMVYAMAEDTEGNIYLGTKGNGLWVLVRKGSLEFGSKHFQHDGNNSYSLSNDNIYSILQDRQKRIWIGTYGGGLNLFDNGRFIHSGNEMENYPQKTGGKIRQIAEDSKGDIWVATTNGIVILDHSDSASNGSFHFFNPESRNVTGLTGTDVYWIYCDKHDTVWVATLGGGLAQLKKDFEDGQPLQFSTFTKADGLPSDVILTIVGDEKGNLWMSTENGISSYNTIQQVFRNYNRHDGIINSGFSEAACAVRKDGTICFGANNGLYRFNPLFFKEDQKIVPLEFTGFQLFNKEMVPGKGSVLENTISETGNIRLKYNQNNITIFWAGLDFSMNNKIRYACQLEGYDSDWHTVQYHGSAGYSKLPPGKYTFRVKFDNPDLQKLNGTKSLKIEILPPWWKTTWAYIVYLLLAITLVETSRKIATTMIRLRNKVVIEKELTDIKLNFFTNISHELRTPLTLILGPVNEIKEKETLSDKGKTYAMQIEQNAQRLLRLVNRLLDFRKVQNGKMELTLSEVDMVEFTKVSCHNFEELAIEKNIRFSVQSTTPSIYCQIDEEKMDSVIFNLLSNAFKFTPENGSIEVSIHNHSSEGMVTIDIIDSGIGISNENEVSLFKVFASHYDSHQTKLSGTGIGLSLSKELVQLHGGELSYRPTPGGGATFRVTLKTSKDPIVTTEPENGNRSETELVTTSEAIMKRSVVAESVGKHALPRVLVVEDNSELRNFLRLQLDEEYLVDEAENGAIGLEKALQLQPDLILSDVLMPEMDGIQLLDKIKNNFETSHIPVVLLTAKSSVESKVEGLKYGADAYMTKPFNSNQLKAQLENLLHQRVLLREHYTKRIGEAGSRVHFTVTDKDAEFLNKVRSIIEEDLANPDFKVEDIYKQIGMGRSKFFDKLKGLTGQSPIDFVREYRLNKAVTLLQAGCYNVTEASYLSGFTDAGYFSKCFKERFGVSPSHYSKKT